MVARECVDKCNATEHSVTGFPPKYLLNGTDVTILPKELKENKKEENWVKDRELVLENTIKSHNKYK